MRRKAFTLVEIMIAVAIIGVLAAIAVPKYQGYTLKGKISKLQVPMEAISGYLDSLNSEGKDLTTVSRIPATILKPFSGSSLSDIKDPSGKYKITVTTSSGNKYTITGEIDGYPNSNLKMDWNGSILDKSSSGKFTWTK